MKYRLIIAGSPSFDNYPLLESAMNLFIQGEIERLRLIGSEMPEIEIVSNYEPGASQHGVQYAQLKGYSVKKFPVNWDRYGKIGPLKTNTEMIQYVTEGAGNGGCVVFWNGHSPETGNLIHSVFPHAINMRIVIF